VLHEDIAAMAAATDIADWCLEEIGLPNAQDMPAQLGADPEAQAAAMSSMFAASPHAHIHSVCRPILLTIGDADRRVPPFQARQCASPSLPPSSTLCTNAYIPMSELENKMMVMMCVADYHALKERGVDTRLLVYPGETHSIGKPDMEGDVYVNTALWFARYDAVGARM
jgi:dipeptidyl aminopeptidase/acylaminoacyl peptidase